MTGTKGKSGGPRKGAGRPPKTARLKDGVRLLTAEYDGNGPVAHDGHVLCFATVSVVGRGKLVLVWSDGRTMRLELA